MEHQYKQRLDVGRNLFSQPRRAVGVLERERHKSIQAFKKVLAYAVVLEKYSVDYLVAYALQLTWSCSLVHKRRSA